jgi:hypothetical protein
MDAQTGDVFQVNTALLDVQALTVQPSSFVKGAMQHPEQLKSMCREDREIRHLRWRRYGRGKPPQLMLLR